MPNHIDQREELLACAVVEHTAKEFELAVGVAQSVAVRYIEHSVVYLHRLGLGVYGQSTLFLQVAVRPDVVVAGEEVNLHTHIR